MCWSVWERRKRKGFTLGGCGFESQLLRVLALIFNPRLLKWGWQSSCHKSLRTRSWAKCFTLVILWAPQNSPISYLLLITLFYRWRTRGTEGWKKWPSGRALSWAQACQSRRHIPPHHVVSCYVMCLSMLSSLAHKVRINSYYYYFYFYFSIIYTFLHHAT